jgi:ketohexokinase
MSHITKTMSFEFDSRPPFAWVHFEGRNVFETAAQIDWLELKATREGWRQNLTISVELDKPDRHNIDILLTRVNLKMHQSNKKANSKIIG